MKASKTSLNCNKIGNLSMTLVLDKRTNKNTEKYPMAICFNIDRTRCTISSSICHFRQRRSSTLYVVSAAHAAG